ncbi:protein of unknown function [Denitratisoma oestradiolicum]|uniref:Uncharacterized protein n=1 Tax=Denitratisoma oestradiolicum TaxID=311182 RepID=A0A6S6XYD2_9PROT|nr:protein of unknown function [Denitratisoma oestradiolicum]
MLLGMHAEDQYRQTGELLLQLFQGIDAVTIGHGHIQQKDIPTLLAGQTQGIRAVLGLAGHHHVLGFGKNLLQALPHNGMVIGNQDMDLVGHGHNLTRMTARTPTPQRMKMRKDKLNAPHPHTPPRGGAAYRLATLDGHTRLR